VPTVKIDGQLHQIPDGPHTRVVMVNDMASRKQYKVEYCFNFPSPEVRVKTTTYDSSYMYSNYAADDSMPIMGEPIEAEETIEHIGNYLVSPEEKRAPGDKNLWATTLDKTPDSQRAKIDRDYKSWKQAETKKRCDRDDEYARREDAARQKSKEDWKAYKATRTQQLFEEKHSGGNPNFAPLYKSKSGDSKMNRMVTGYRVRISDPMGEEKYAYGTVVEVKEPLIQSHTLLCMDRPSEHYVDSPDICGENHGYLVTSSSLRAASYRSRSAAYEGLPEHIGLFNQEPFDQDNIHFPRHSVGRIVELNGDRATCIWKNVKELGGQPFHVPAGNLRWCRFNPETNTVSRTWYTTHMPHVAGDILVYWSDKPHMISGSRHGYPITRGVLLRHVSHDLENRGLIVVPLSGMPKEYIGVKVKIPKNSVRKFEEPFIDVGEEVEIVAEVMFKKKNLQRSRGKVILATDFEGDIGIQFPEDIGAGSLDGIGKEGRCLYIPAESVEKVSG